MKKNSIYFSAVVYINALLLLNSGLQPYAFAQNFSVEVDKNKNVTIYEPSKTTNLGNKQGKIVVITVNQYGVIGVREYSKDVVFVSPIEGGSKDRAVIKNTEPPVILIVDKSDRPIKSGPTNSGNDKQKDPPTAHGAIHTTMGGQNYFFNNVAPGMVANAVNAFVGSQNTQMEQAQRRVTAALLNGAHENTMAQLRAEMSKMPGVDPKELELHQQWIDRLQSQLNLGPKQSLESLAPGLAKGIVDHDYVETINGLDDFNRVLLTQQRGLPDEFRIENKIKGAVVDEEGLIRGLPDAPRPIHLESKWDSVDGVRIRGSLNRMMVSKQIITNEYRDFCAENGEEACKAGSAKMREFDAEYTELSYIHGIADRMSVRHDSYFDLLMKPLEDVSTVCFAYASVLLKHTVHFMDNSVVLAENVAKDTAAALKNVPNLVPAAANALDESAEFIGELSAHPKEKLSKVSTALAEVYLHSKATAKKLGEVLGKAVNKEWDKYLNGTLQERSELVADASVEIVTLFPNLFFAGVKASEGMGGIAEISKLMEVMENEKKVETLPQAVGELTANGTFNVLKEATEKSLDTTAVLRKIDSLEEANAIDALAAEDAKAVANVFPKAGNEILKNPQLLEAADGMGHVSKNSPLSSLMQPRSADEALAAMFRKQGAIAVSFVKRYGFNAGANVASLEGLCPGLFTDWEKAGRLEELAAVSRNIDQTIAGARHLGFDSPERLRPALRNAMQAIEGSKAFLQAALAAPPKKASFYLKSSGEAIPTTGYRYLDSKSSMLKAIQETGHLPPPLAGKPYYISFDKYGEMTEAQQKLQLFRRADGILVNDARFRVEFDTLHIADRLTIPTGKMGSADYLEPIVKSYPEFGEGGGTQAFAHAQIRVSGVVDLKTGRIIYGH